MRAKTVHRCVECGAVAPQWSGRCAMCGEWNTLVEEREERAAPAGRLPIAGDAPVPIGEVPGAVAPSTRTGIDELDRVLGGGLVAGSVTLLGGEPGIGKSTLVLQALAAIAAAGGRALLVSAEESLRQVRLRAERLEAVHPQLLAMSETSLPAIVAAVDDVSPDVLVVDSIQTVCEPDLASSPGSVVQVRECAHQLVGLAKQRGMATLLVGHVTKDGALAGPRVLEHVVDTVLSFEGERHHALRVLRAQKHRFGSTGEVGVFEMGEGGLSAVADPSQLFLADRQSGVPGSVILPTIDGRRPLVVELQALVTPSWSERPRRSAHSVDANRLALVLAVIENRVGVRLGPNDVYVSAVGGVRIADPGADLAIALAVASAAQGQVLTSDLAACGEVGLGGEIRQVGHMARRFSELARLGFTDVIAPPSAPADPPGLRVWRARTLLQALTVAGVTERALVTDR